MFSFLFAFPRHAPPRSGDDVTTRPDPCAPNGPLPTVRLAAHAMGTRFEFILCGENERTLHAAGEEAIEAIEDAHRRLSRFEAGGPVFEINRCAGERSVLVDDEIRSLLERCEDVRACSDGAFDIVRSKGAPLPHRPLVIDGRSVGLSLPGAFIDLGGVAKGFALDLAGEIVRAAGITSALLHGGSSTILAIGSAPDGEAWRVALAAGDRPIGVARLCDAAMSVSSQEGDRPGHVVDPATGRSASGPRWAACLADSAEATDAWATALLVRAGRPEGMPAALTSVHLDENARIPIASGPASSCIVSGG